MLNLCNKLNIRQNLPEKRLFRTYMLFLLNFILKFIQIRLISFNLTDILIIRMLQLNDRLLKF